MRTGHPLAWLTKPQLPALLVAVAAMLLQAVIYSDHIGAVAAKSLDGAGDGTRLGWLEICTGDGIELRPDGSVPDGSSDCPICTNASMLAFGEPAELPPPVFPFVPFTVVWEIPAQQHLAQARIPAEQPIRAPPASFA